MGLLKYLNYSKKYCARLDFQELEVKNPIANFERQKYEFDLLEHEANVQLRPFWKLKELNS
jgi:hypothetical protein